MNKGDPLIFPEALKGAVEDVLPVYGKVLKYLGVDLEKLVRRIVKKYLELEKPLRATWGAARSTASSKAVSKITLKLASIAVGESFTVPPRYNPSTIQSNMRTARKRTGNPDLSFYIARGVNEVLIKRIEDGTRKTRQPSNWKVKRLASMKVGETILWEDPTFETYLKIGARVSLGNNNADWQSRTSAGERKVRRIR